MQQHEKILDKLEGLADFPWSFKASEGGCSMSLRGEVFDKHGCSIFWLSTEFMTGWLSKANKQSVKLLALEFIAEAPMIIVKLLEEIEELKEQISKGKTRCQTNTTKAKKIPRNS
jgi:hypothetical protein